MNLIPLSVFAVIMREDGKILGVTRRNCEFTTNQSFQRLFGLPGGKVDEYDSTIEYAITRELKEETNLTGMFPFVVHSSYYQSTNSNYIATTFCFKRILGELKNLENEGKLAWVPPYFLTQGLYGDYNIRVFDAMRIPWKAIYPDYNSIEFI